MIPGIGIEGTTIGVLNLLGELWLTITISPATEKQAEAFLKTIGEHMALPLGRFELYKTFSRDFGRPQKLVLYSARAHAQGEWQLDRRWKKDDARGLFTKRCVWQLSV